jgi:hypothetical protein
MLATTVSQNKSWNSVLMLINQHLRLCQKIKLFLAEVCLPTSSVFIVVKCVDNILQRDLKYVVLCVQPSYCNIYSCKIK